MRPLLHAALAVACLATALSLPSPARAADPVKVAIIVGPVGSLTPTYLALADAAATAAERHGATVARAYSPNATPANVLAAVADANVIVYFGHGYGHPSPYGGLDTRRQNGWALQGPLARGTHDDGLNGYVQYYGEDWIVANARPAPGFVMIYSNTCYAPGASEGGHAAATPWSAAERVAYYSRKVFTMGGSAYYATDFDHGAADLVDRILGNRRATYGSIFAADARYVPAALTVQPHLFSPGQQIWLHRTKYTDGPANYWYAFAGNPDASPLRSWDPVAPTAVLERPVDGRTDVDPRVSPKLRISEEVAGVNASSVRLLGPGGRPVKADVVHNRATGAVRIVPAEPLALGSGYTVAVEKGIADAAGNALAPTRWTFLTRLDADPLIQALPITLASGSHRLIRLAADGSVAEERTVQFDDERSMLARSRARLPGQHGSWFELEPKELAGWWVAESGRVHAPGRVEEVMLEPTEVALVIPAESSDATVDGGDPTAPRTVTVDRRAVVEGRSYLRLAGGLPGEGGRWVEAPADLLPPDAGEQRILEIVPRPAPAELHLADEGHLAFRFDSAGRVLDRASVPDDVGSLGTAETLVVAGARFHVVVDGALAGWAIADGPGVSVRVPEARDPS